VAASPTYNLQLYLPMDMLLHDMAALGLKNRKVALIGNHSWSSAALKTMQDIFSGMKDMEIIGTPMDVRSTLKPQREEELDQMAGAIASSILQG
jgi:flavorubredoxin